MNQDFALPTAQTFSTNTQDVSVQKYPPILSAHLLGQGLKKSPIGQKLDFANHPYLCKGLTIISAI
jgi:hypothetical protein